MSSILDFYKESESGSDEFPIPPEAQFADDADMEPGTKAKHSVKSDWEVRSFRGNKDAVPGKHVINLRVKGVESDYDGTGEVAYWFEASDFDEATNPYAAISKKQVGGLAHLVCAMGLCNPEAFEGTQGFDAVPIIIDAAGKYGGNGYTFGGTLQFVKSCKPDGRVFMNHNLYFNHLPQVVVPF